MIAPRLEQLRTLAETTLGSVAARWPAIEPWIAKLRSRLARSSPEAQPSAVSPELEIRTKNDVRRLLDALANAPTWQARMVAASGLSEFEGDEVVDALIRAVRDPSVEVAVAAISSLANQPNERAMADLREVLKETAGFIGPLTRSAAVEAIASCQGRTALPLLLESIHDADAEVSMAAIQSAARIAPTESAPKLLALLEDGTGYYLPIVRITAARSLERIDAIPPGIASTLLSTEGNEGVRVVLERVVRDAP